MLKAVEACAAKAQVYLEHGDKLTGATLFYLKRNLHAAHEFYKDEDHQ